MDKFDTLVINDQKFESKNKSLGVLNKDLKQTITDYNWYLIGCNTFEFVFEDQLGSEIFGNLIVVFNFMIEIILFNINYYILFNINFL